MIGFQCKLNFYILVTTGKINFFIGTSNEIFPFFQKKKIKDGVILLYVSTVAPHMLVKRDDLKLSLWQVAVGLLE